MNFRLIVSSCLVIFLAVLIPSPDNSFRLLQQFNINPSQILEDYDPHEKFSIFDNKKIPIPPQTDFDYHSNVLGENNLAKRIHVDLTSQTLYAYEDDKLVHEFPVSSGRWNSTPNGTFTIWAKVKSQKMSGGSKEKGTYYYLPNVPHILFFYNDKVAKRVGYSIHGAYWHNNFGQPMSHGCINMSPKDAAVIYAFADTNTKITIAGKYLYK